MGNQFPLIGEGLAKHLGIGQPEEGKEPAPSPPASVFAINTVGSMGDMGIFWLLLIYLAKNGQSARVAEILKLIVHDTFSSLHWYTRAGAANRITAWGAGFLNSCVLERFGFITQGQALGFSIGNNVVAGMELGTGVARAIADMVPKLNFGSRDVDDGFPDQITMADTIYNVEKEDGYKLTPYGKLLPKGEAGKSITLEAKGGKTE